MKWSVCECVRVYDCECVCVCIDVYSFCLYMTTRFVLYVHIMFVAPTP